MSAEQPVAEQPRSPALPGLRPRGGARPWPRLAAAWPVGHVTVADVLAAPSAGESDARVRAWAGDVWGGYRDHQGRVCGWLDRIVS